MESKDLIPLLRSVGLKTTRPRLAVLGLLAHARTPLRVKDIAATLQKKKIVVDTVTIYRTIETLVEMALVDRINFEEDAAYYQLAEGDRHYIVCIRCDRREPTSDCLFKENSARLLAAAPAFASIDRHSIMFFGVCKKCAKSAKRSRS